MSGNDVYHTLTPETLGYIDGVVEPTPDGVPVEIRSPGSSVTNREMKAMTAATGKIIWPVVPSCLVSPFTRSLMANDWGSATASAESKQGPTGQKVSCHLP